MRKVFKICIEITEQYDSIYSIENHSQNIGGDYAERSIVILSEKQKSEVRLGFQIALQCAPFFERSESVLRYYNG